MGCKINVQAKTFLGFVFPGECHEIKKDLEYIFDEEFARACHTSFSFQQCFKDYKVGLLFKNEKKKPGATE